jgi:predicted DNA-binding transcriptional regulator AlpA
MDLKMIMRMMSAVDYPRLQRVRAMSQRTLPNAERYGHADEVCQVLGGIARSTVYSWLNDPAKNFPRSSKIDPGTVVWETAEVVAWADARAQV